jgi:hypothetical protein
MLTGVWNKCHICIVLHEVHSKQKKNTEAGDMKITYLYILGNSEDLL